MNKRYRVIFLLAVGVGLSLNSQSAEKPFNEALVCKISAYKFENRISKCKKGDVLVIEEADHEAPFVAAKVCVLETIKLVGAAIGNRRTSAICVYQGEIRGDRS